MWMLTIRGLRAHRVRLALAAVAVVLGVAFVGGTLTLTGSLERSYDAVFTAVRSGADLVVRPAGPVGPEGTGARFPVAVRDRVANAAGVARADGVVQGQARLVDRAGVPVTTGVAPTLAVSWSQPGRDGPLRIVGDGTPPRGDGEVAVDVGAAERIGVRVGDRVRVAGAAAARAYRVSALVAPGGLGDLGGTTLALFDLPTTQEVVGAGDRLDEVLVRVASGSDPDVVAARLRADLGSGFDVVSVAVAAAGSGTRLRELLAVVRASLVAFAGVGMAVVVLLVGQTFAVLGAQRRREIALLRIAGATRRQVVGAAVVEAGVFGVGAAAPGALLGVVAAGGALAVLRALGSPVPDGGVAVAPGPVGAAFAVGVLASVVAALPAALRAAAGPVLPALADDRAWRPHRRPLVGALLAVAGAGALVTGVRAGRWATGASGPLTWFGIGAVMLAGAGVVVLGPVLAGAGRRRSARGPIGRRLAGRELGRDPRRAAATGGALLVVSGLVVAALVFGASARDSVGAAIDAGVRAQVVLRDPQFTGFSADAAVRVADAGPGIRAVSPFAFRRVRVDGRVETAGGTPGRTLGRTVDLDLVRGRPGALRPGRVLLSERLARALGVTTGDSVTVQMARTAPALRVAGIYRRDTFSGAYTVPLLVDSVDYDTGFGSDGPDTLVFVRTAGDPDAVRGALDRTLAGPFPDVEVLSRDGFRAQQMASADRILSIVLALAILAVVLAVLGVANVLFLSVVERTRTIGLLRAVGATSRQVRSVLRSEALTVTTLSTVLGVGVGVVWGGCLAAALPGLGVTTVAVPVLRIAAVGLLLAVAGLGAAALPARRATRIDVLGAVGDH